MSLLEIKERIARLTPDERLELAGLIAHLNQSDSIDYQEELDRRLASMDQGKKFTQQDLARLNREIPPKD